MPRAARKKSSSNIYHIILRGINKQRIFEDDEDNQKFIETLSDCKKISAFNLYAYCLMGNHVHLLLEEKTEELGTIFKRIGSKYVYWYNWKYSRTGHLFQDRFKSETVEDEKYLLTVIRYIHQNPVKAGLEKSIGNYSYSSYREYITTSNDLIDTEFIYNIISKEQFIIFNNQINKDKCMDFDDDNRRITDDEGRQLIKEISNCCNPSQFQELSTISKTEYIKLIHNEGLSIRQITRLTGISKALVEKALK